MRLCQLWVPVAAFALLLSSQVSHADGPKPRLTAPINNADRVRLADAHPELAAKPISLGVDQGALPADTSLQGVTLVFNRTAAQQADLSTLLAAQQNPASALYHHWLTPDQFAARFGVADADIAKTQVWLQAQGFQVSGTSRSRDRVTFNATAGQVAAAFRTEIHRYASTRGTHFAPAGDLSLPATLAPMVAGVLRLSDLHPQRRTRLQPAAVRPAYTSSQTGDHFLTPSDVATMYDLTPTYKAGYNGAGQSVAIIGQSYIETAPVAAFQSGAGLAANLPTMVLVPNTGVNGINPVGDGDEGESQLDVEYASGMAPGATIFFVYTGDDSNSGVFDSLQYAISENIAPVISGSYGLCEPDLQAEGSSGVQAANVINQEVLQANAQGQTVIFSSGDSGSTDCYGDPNLTTPAAQEVLAVDFPASIPSVTAMGGTQMAAGTFAATNTQYWQSASGTDVISSLLSYVPETAWNEDISGNSTISSGGGGTSVLFPRPSWQAGVAGIPTGTNRLVPDLALQASVESPGYIYCTSDPSDLAFSNLTSSCTNGLRSPSSTFVTAGGTSFAAPIFAGMLAVLNQATHATGQGNVNQTLYTLAANAGTYSGAFHDITAGSNACAAGPTYCSTAGASSYAATTGYDEATGLGSIDFAKLVAAWPVSAAASLTATTTVATPATGTPTGGATDQITITIAPQGSSTDTPTGTVQIAVDGAVITPTLPLSNGKASYTYTAPATTGSYVVTAIYSGDTVFASSTGTAVLNVGSATPTGSFALAAANLTVVYNSTGTANISITPAAGYTGTVALSLSYPSNAPTLCYALSNSQSNGSNVPLINSLPVPVTLTIGEGTICGTTTAGAVLPGGGRVVLNATRGRAPGPPMRRWPEGIAFAGLFGAGLFLRRSRRLPSLLGLVFLAAVGLGLSGCGGSNGGTTTPVNPTKALTLTLTGTDSINTSISNSTTFTLTLQQ